MFFHLTIIIDFNLFNITIIILKIVNNFFTVYLIYYNMMYVLQCILMLYNILVTCII